MSSRWGRSGWLVAGMAVSLSIGGCAAAQPAAPSPAAPTAVDRPPLAADLAGGTPVTLGAAGHWAIHGATAFVGSPDGVQAIDLDSGEPLWLARFGSGEPAWDGTPTVGASTDGSTVVALRTVGEGSLELLRVTGTGEVIDSRLVDDPDGSWRVDLPPSVLAVDDATAVMAENPEWGTQAGVLDLATAAVEWVGGDHAHTADQTRVVTRTGARDRLTGAPLWRSDFPLGTVVALSPDALVVEDHEGGQVVWLDPRTGAHLAATPAAAELPACRAAATTVVCVGAGVAGYDLATGTGLWSRADGADAATTYRDWAYLWTDAGRGDVVAARTGEPVATDAQLTPIVFSNDAGVLVERGGTFWVPLE